MNVFASKPTALIGTPTSNLNIFWYASTIVHEATHSFIFFRARQQGRNGVEEYKGHDAEMFCLTRQIQVLKNIQAPDYLIKHAEGLYNSTWYEAPSSKRNW